MTRQSKNPVPAWLRGLAARAVQEPPLRPGNGQGREAAVLLLFGEGPEGPDLLLIQRSDRLSKHAGQPAFPGGGVDPGDGGPVEAALREAEEETGLDRSGVEIIATFPEVYLWASDNRVTPVLAWWREPSPVRPADAYEVAAVHRVAVAELADPANRFRLRTPPGYIGPAFRVSGMLVWGFTAGIVDRLLALSGFERAWDRTRVEQIPPDLWGLANRG